MSKSIKQIISNRSIQNAGWIIGEQVFQMILSLVVGVFTARYLGPSNFGALNYTASFVTFFTAIATLGMEGVVIKKLIAYPEDEGLYLGSCMVLRIISSVLSIIAIFVVVILLNPNEPIKWTLVLIQSTSLVFKAIYILDTWFQRHLKSKYVSIAKMITSIIVYSYKVFLLITSKSLIWFAFSNTLSDIIISAVLVYFYVKQKGQKPRVEIRKGTEVLSESYHFIISGIMVAIYGQMDRIMLGKMLDDTSVGLYTTASVICGMWIFVPTAIINSFRPKIMEIKKQGEESKYELRLTQLYSLIIWLCILFSIAICLFARLIISILYGEAYIGAVNPLRIIIWCETFSMIGTARGIWVLCENKNKYVKYYLGIGSVVNLILNFVLIPIWGINGAAFATLLTQITTSIVAPLFFKETRYHTAIVLKAFSLYWYFRREKTK